MSKSKAQKYREKLKREGKRNPEKSRSPFVLIDLRTRKTKTKKDIIYRTKHKTRQITKNLDGSFLFSRALYGRIYIYTP